MGKNRLLFFPNSLSISALLSSPLIWTNVLRRSEFRALLTRCHGLCHRYEAVFFRDWSSEDLFSSRGLDQLASNWFIRARIQVCLSRRRLVLSRKNTKHEYVAQPVKISFGEKSTETFRLDKKIAITDYAFAVITTYCFPWASMDNCEFLHDFTNYGSTILRIRVSDSDRDKIVRGDNIHKMRLAHVT